MAIAFDASTQGSTGGSPHSYSHTCTGTDRILYVHIFLVGGARTISAISYNSVAMTLVDSRINAGADSTAFLYRLVNPDSGSNTVSITFSATFGVSVATSYTGAKQSGGVFVSGTGIGNPTVTIDITPNSADNWIVMACGADDQAPTAANSSFLRQVGANVAITAFDTNGGVSALTTMGATSNIGVFAVAESFEPSAGGVKLLTLLGVGV